MRTIRVGDVANGNIGRVVAVGASNLTRGFHTVVATARSLWGPDVEVMAALGHGRSYGGPSTFLVRGLPGILQSGLWRELESHPPAQTRALVTDVGNDIMYGHPPAQILEWVDGCVARLRRFTPDVVVTSLPDAATTGLPAARYLFLRSIFFPRCRLSLEDILRIGREVDRGLETIAADRGATFRRLRPEWYGLDPIHIRPRDVARGVAGHPLRQRAAGRRPARVVGRGGPPLLHAARVLLLLRPRVAHAPARRGAARGRTRLALLKKKQEARRAY